MNESDAVHDDAVPDGAVLDDVVPDDVVRDGAIPDGDTGWRGYCWLLIGDSAVRSASSGFDQLLTAWAGD